MDFEYLNSLCLNDSGTKASAFKAFQLLWKSGADGVLITKPDSTLNVIPGGLLGGLLATSIYTVCGRIVTCILLIGYTFALIVRIFQISVKKTAKAFGKATKNSINRYKNEYENRGNISFNDWVKNVKENPMNPCSVPLNLSEVMPAAPFDSQVLETYYNFAKENILVYNLAFLLEHIQQATKTMIQFRQSQHVFY